MFSGFTRIVLVNGCSKPAAEKHFQHRTTIDAGKAIKVVLAEADNGKTLKIFLSDQEEEGK